MNIKSDGAYKINLLQCRPLQIRQAEALDREVPAHEPEDLVIESHGAVLGYSRQITIDRLIYVVPEAYGRLPTQERYAVARLIGKLVHLDEPERKESFMLLGPGRWGTKMPELGVPVGFSEINTVSVLCEIDAMHEGLVPDLSLGTHFFHEMVEMNMLYLGFFKAREGNVLNQQLLDELPSLLAELLPDASQLARVVRVIDAPAGRRMIFVADHMKQEARLFLKDV